MKVIFLDFDGVLNSAASFVLENRIRKGKYMSKKRQAAVLNLPPVNETLCHVCTSNFQHILDEVPDAKIVISSTWRQLFDLDWLRAKLVEYGVDGSRVIDKTPVIHFRFSQSVDRGVEIKEWLDQHPEVTNFVILDDNYIGPPFQPNHIETGPNFVKSTWNVGLTLPLAIEAVKILGGKDRSYKLHLE